MHGLLDLQHLQLFRTTVIMSKFYVNCGKICGLSILCQLDYLMVYKIDDS